MKLKIKYPDGDFIEVHGTPEFQNDCVKQFEETRKQIAAAQKNVQRGRFIDSLYSKLAAKNNELLDIRSEIRRIENELAILREAK